MIAEFTIREASPDDAEQMVAHMARIGHELDNNVLLTPGEFKLSVEEEREKIAELADADNAVWLVAEVDGQIIGVLDCRGGRRAANRHSGGLGISVRKDWRNRGVGTALMEALIDWARANPVITRLELEVFTHNARAIHLYEKLGFQIEGCKRRAYFKDGRYVDAYLMALLL